ncbi:hypothetical protein CEY12_09005 [Chryseobacterium sp. T16E-39]|uniref:hypothetical protein n=1 Tax=Chryseobacterium sp. T16E-39 TaxID=2015076 RepID=UPI000B5B1D95|nr:hypothetical protein [Chryseobacterium sp. T16E-39]ASK30243.1 hypothetical protein CEY12_09005 [Chryseobacterium sp. T16E-39]
MNTKTIFLFLFLITTFKIFAYPIEPRPLRKLIIESENIVYAKVKDIKENKLAKPSDWNNSHIAILVIQEVLQGKLNTQTIEVYFSPEFSCPMPAHYKKGTTVLAFLDKNKDEEGYKTHALSYGAKILKKEKYSIYKNRIIEMQKILEIKDENEKKIKTTDWLVDCSLDPVTREEGIFDLTSNTNFMYFAEDTNKKPTYEFELNEIQKNKLRAAFFAAKKIDTLDLEMVDLVKKENDKELLDFLILNFKKQNEKENVGDQFMMMKIADLTNRNDLKQIIKKSYDTEIFDKDYFKIQKQIVKEFVSKL